MIDPNAIVRDAHISFDGKYRWWLTRRWEEQDIATKSVTFLMINPSTADAAIDDATIRKCMGFADRWGYTSIVVVNLFALRSREPKALLESEDPIGSANDAYLLDRVGGTAPVVLAWGCDATLARKKALSDRVTQVLAMFRSHHPDKQLFCLGRTKSGAPRHPLMLAYSTPLVPFPNPAPITEE